MKGGGVMEKMKRLLRIIWFVVVMVASLLVISAPVLVAIGDIGVPCLVVSNFSCIRCYTFKEHLGRYNFKNSLTDIPLVSVIRSFIITCAFLLCDSSAISHGPYFGTVALSSLGSVLLLSVKACVFTINSQLEAEASSFSKHKIHLKKSWGMPVLFLSSVVFALGHTVLAYRTSCRARRKLLFHRGEAETVLSCKHVFSGLQKVARSPTPSHWKTFKSDSELRRKQYGFARGKGELPVRLLADVDSLFVLCEGLNVHYKLALPGFSLRALASAAYIDLPSPTGMTGGQYRLHKSHSNQYHPSSLHTPLLDGYPKSPVLSEDMPALNIDAMGDDDETMHMGSPPVELDLEANGQFGIVLVHGFGGGVFSWRNVVGVLAQQTGCAVVAFDRPGWGLTSRPRRKDWEENQLYNPYKLESQVDLLISFCSKMGFSSVVLVGHDDGGLLVLKAAERTQSSPTSLNVEIKGVVLLGTSLSREVVPAFARILLFTSLGKKRLIRSLLRTEITQVVNRRAWYDITKLTTEVLNLYKAPLRVEGWDEALHEIGKLSSEMVLSSQSAASLLKAVKTLPVLVIAGAEDALVPLKSVHIMASKLENSRLVAISACGHLPHEECPKALLEAIIPFITRLLMDSDSQN
ncbi:serine protease [Lithospermum erythrorhizon]|uniref:Serine protease n=1 Tax=Lithospermum erythrorhizon TaxID=34254 RepID=A0AAV3QXU4_LITER